MSEEIRKNANKQFKVYRTICEMAKDRGYSNDADDMLNSIKSKDQENIWIQNQISSQQQALSIPSFAHNSNEDEINKKINMEQHLYVFHSTGKLTEDSIKSFDSTIHRVHELSVMNNTSLNIFVNVIILVPEDKDSVPKKVQDIFLISNKVFKDRIELFEKRQVELNFGTKRGKETNIPDIRSDKGSSIQIFFKYEVFFFDDLVINITKHQLVPKHVPLNAIEKKKLMDKYNITDAQLPKILGTDPITKYFGLRTKQVFKIERDSETAGKYITYRIVS